jgi:hypothetical protein
VTLLRELFSIFIASPRLASAPLRDRILQVSFRRAYARQ